ncbi:MAG: hypothetical protein M3Q65_08710 [Chloroflexota bacterium]|nr:hypothetical protein [Chloroflexota bacterium]
MPDQPERTRRSRRRPAELAPPDVRTLAGARASYSDLAARLDVLSWSRGTFAEREGWLWDEVWHLAAGRGIAAPPRRPPERVPPPAPAGIPLFPEGIRKEYRDLGRAARLLAATDEAAFGEREAALWRAFWALAESRGIAE